MTYIKLSDEMVLSITKGTPIHQGENLSQALVFILPTKIGEVLIGNSSVYLSYIRPDGTPDIAELEQASVMYDPNHYKYLLPVTCKITRIPGPIRIWLQILTGDSPAVISKTNECILTILESENIDDLLCNHQITALYRMNKRIDEIANSDSSDCPSDNPSDGEDSNNGYDVVEF